MRCLPSFSSWCHCFVIAVVVAPAGCATPGTPSPSFGLGGKGTPWTIRCKEIQGTNRTPLIAQFAESLRNTPGVRPKDVFTRDDADGFARLFYGTYWRKLDKKTGKHSINTQLQQDLDMIRQLGDAAGQRYFTQAMMLRLPTDDVGNPAWNLARQAGVYSLQVAVFEPSEDFWEFKQAAAEYCEYLRDKDHEAYYHHSPASSVVTVGLFGQDAVIKQSAGLPRISDRVQQLQQNDLLRYNRLNGAIYYLTDGKKQRTPVPSRLVEIPRESESAAP